MYIRIAMEGIIHLDTLYLIVKYPYLDVFREWYRHASGIDYRKLKEGIAVGDFVVRGGSSCYKVSAWQHDARVFFTDQVDENIGEGKGAGIWVQLGPKFIIEHFYHLHEAVNELLASVGVKGDYPIKVNRLDLAIDLFDVSMKEQDISFWQSGWVGRSKVSNVVYNSRTGELETIYVGSRKSPIFLRAYDKIAEAVKDGDLDYWLDIWKEYTGVVTRIEWQIKPSDGKFYKDLQDFKEVLPITFIELLNYLLDEWGRLCIPNPSDTNNRRWKDAPLWELAKKVRDENAEGVDWPISRYGKEYHGISEGYVKFVSGTFSGAMARFGEDNPNMVSMLKGLEKHGHSLERMQKEANKKAQVISKL